MNDKEQEKLAGYIYEAYYNDPAEYCRGVLGFEPDKWQRAALESVRDNRRTAVRSGHGVGKTRIAAAILHWFIATRPYPQIVCTSNTSIQLSTKLWRELAVIHAQAKNKDMFEWLATSYKLRAAPDRWFASAIPWSKEKPEAFAGTHEENVLMLFDEASAIPDIIWDTASGAMTTSGARWLALGNPTRNTGKFHECFGKNMWREGDTDDIGLWHAFTMSCLDSERPGMNMYIEEQKREYGEDSDFYRIRVLGLPPKQEVQQFISLDLFQSAANRPVIEQLYAPKILGVDPAWFGEDRTALVARQGLKIWRVAIRRGQDTMATAGDVINELNTARQRGVPYDHVVVDTVGIGAGVHDRLREQGIQVSGVNVGIPSRMPNKYHNLRSELWDLYKQWLPTGTIEPEFQDDSCGIQYMFDSAGRLTMERKPDLKKRGLASPDLADAACLTFYIAGVNKPQLQTTVRQRTAPGSGWRR